MPLSQTEINRLTTHEWRVHTTDKITQDRMVEYLLAHQEEPEPYREKICPNGTEIDVFVVKFPVVLFLAKNRHSAPFDFTAYHRPGKSGPWSAWKEGKKSPVQKLRSLNHLFKGGATPISKALKQVTKKKIV